MTTSTAYSSLASHCALVFVCLAGTALRVLACTVLGALPRTAEAARPAQQDPAQQDPAQQASLAPASLALLIGINKYAEPAEGEGLTQLHGAANDVARARMLLVEQFRFAEGDIKTLIGPEATHEAIVTQFHRHLIERAGPDTRVVFWFSGHGSRIPDASGRDAAPRGTGESAWDDTLVAYDSRAVDPKGSFDLADDELFSLLRALRARDVVVITDCCHSGGVLRTSARSGVRDGGRGSVALDVTRVRKFWPNATVPLHDDDADIELPHVVQIVACGATEEAGEVEFANGTFGTCTYYLSRALRDAGPETTWAEVADRTRAQVAGQGTRGFQRVGVVGDGMRRVLGGRGRPAPPGFTVEPFGAKDMIVDGGAIHGLGIGARLQLVDYDRKELGVAVVDRVNVSSSRASWQGQGELPRVALRAQPKTFGTEAPSFYVALGPGLSAALLADVKVAAVADAAKADYSIARDGDVLALFDREKRWVRQFADDPADLQVALLREHYWRSLWHSAAAPGTFRLRLTVTTATAEDAAEHGIPAADRVRIEQGPDGTIAGIVGVSCFDDTRNSGGLVRLKVENLSDSDLHVAIVSVSENREIGVLYGKDSSNVIAAGKDHTKVVWLGRDDKWPGKDAMVDRYVVIATPNYADFQPFEAPRPVRVTRGNDDHRALPSLLREALGGSRTRGDVGSPMWGVAYVDVQLVTPAAFDAMKGR